MKKGDIVKVMDRVFNPLYAGLTGEITSDLSAGMFTVQTQAGALTLYPHELTPYVGCRSGLGAALPHNQDPPRMQWSTVPETPVWEMADRLTKGLTGGDDPTKVRGIYGWRDMYRKDPEGTVGKYKDSLMRHLRDADWVGVMTNAAILRDLETFDAV